MKGLLFRPFKGLEECGKQRGIERNKRPLEKTVMRPEKWSVSVTMFGSLDPVLRVL